MKHAREDYNRIQDPAGLIPDDEPVFLLRGQDQFAARAVLNYAAMCRQAGLHEIADNAYRHAERMHNWPKKKMPDLPALSAPDRAPTENAKDGAP